LVLALTFDRDDATLRGSVSSGLPSAVVSGRHAIVHPLGTPRSSSVLTGPLALDTAALANSAVPQGAGAMKLRRSVFRGTTSIFAVGVLADGQRFTFGSVLCDNSETPLRALLYRGQGSLQGHATITPVGANHELSGLLDWRKLDPDGFAANLEATGNSVTP
jgi:hypothetical protein